MKAAWLAAFVLTPVVCLAQDGRLQPIPTPAFHSGSSLVALNVTVQDRGSKFIRGLQPDDFAVYEDGVRQDVSFFESTQVPLDLIVLLDTSASMRDRMDLVHDAASGFVRTLRPGDRGAIIGFASSVTILQPFTPDHALLEKAIRGARAVGDTSLNNAVYIALKTFGLGAQQDGQVRRQAIVVLSDGADTASLVSFEDVLALSRTTGVSVYTVMMQSVAEAEMVAKTGERRGEEEADYTMRALAKETGAQAFFPAPSGLKAVYDSIAAELASQYSIGYVPVNSSADGRFRHVLVQVVTRPELHSRTRLGYTADAAPLAAHR